jgi:hypothetical protein
LRNRYVDARFVPSTPKDALLGGGVSSWVISLLGMKYICPEGQGDRLKESLPPWKGVIP